jgi:hypothetical protein
MISYYKDKTCK